MKYITILAAAAFALTAGVECQAQSKPEKGNSVNKTTNDKTIAPASEIQAAGVEEEADERITNVSQTRDYEMEQINGYYQMPGHRDWGSNARLNGFMYPIINPALHPEADIDTSGNIIQSGLYGEGNVQGTGTPVRKMVDQEERARKMPLTKPRH